MEADSHGGQVCTSSTSHMSHTELGNLLMCAGKDRRGEQTPQFMTPQSVAEFKYKSIKHHHHKFSLLNSQSTDGNYFVIPCKTLKHC